MSRINVLVRRRADLRRRVALAQTSLILADAERYGVDITVVGSLATGRFRAHSDIDLFVRGETNPARRAAVERIVADRLRGTGIPYDLIFASDLPPERIQEFLDDIVQSSGLREAFSEDRPRGP